MDKNNTISVTSPSTVSEVSIASSTIRRGEKNEIEEETVHDNDKVC